MALQTRTFESRCNGTYGSHYVLKITVIENSISTDGNKSNVTINVTNKSEGNTWGNYGYANPTTIYVDGIQKAYNNPTTDYRNQKENLLCTWTGDIEHNADGTKSINVSASFSSIATHLSGGSVSGNVTLTTIPRASTVTANDSNIGSVSNIVIARASDKFTHTIKYNFGNLSGTIATKTSSTIIGFTVPTSFYEQIPNAKSGICTITCETYNGNTLIGTKNTTFIVTASEELCKPTLSASAIDVNQTTIALTGDSNKFVNGYSNAQVTYSAIARNSATLKTVTVNGVSASSQAIINKIMTGKITVIATDSRGYSTTVTINKTLINYIPLSVNPNFYRTSPTTGQVSLSFSGNYFNSSFGKVANTLSLSWAYRIKGSSSWTTGGTLVQDTHYVVNGNTFHSGTGSSQTPFIIGSDFDYRNNYEFILYYADKLVSTNTIRQVPKGNPIAYWNDTKFRVNGFLEVNSENDTSLKLYTNGIERARLRANEEGQAVLGSQSDIFIRPKGHNNTLGQLKINSNGMVTTNTSGQDTYIKQYLGVQQDFDNALTEGYYNIGGSNLANAPYSGNIYGKLIVDINTCTYWNGSNNWIWQKFEDTYGNTYQRQRINAGSWSQWYLVYRTANKIEKLVSAGTGAVHASSTLGQEVSITLVSACTNYNLICVRVSNNNGNEGQWITIPVASGFSFNTGGAGKHYYFNVQPLSSWFFRGYVRITDDNLKIAFTVREISGYTASDITVSDVIGIRSV